MNITEAYDAYQQAYFHSVDSPITALMWQCFRTLMTQTSSYPSHWVGASAEEIEEFLAECDAKYGVENE